MSIPHISALKIGDTVIKNNIVVLLYSRSQDAFHIESFIAFLQSNMIAFLADRPTDYNIIGIFENREACDKVLTQMTSIRDARQNSKQFVSNILNSLSL